MDNPDTSTLTVKSPLESKRLQWQGLDIYESLPAEICSISSNLGQSKRLQETFKQCFDVDLPFPGKLKHYKDGSIFWTGQEQWFIESINSPNPYFDLDMAKILNGSATITLQTDAWISLDLKGDAVLSVLERLIKVNLDPINFPPESAIRTNLAHMNVFIQRPNQDTRFKILGARSYAKSLLHSLIQAADNVLGQKKS